MLHESIDTRASYDRVASDYAARLGDELQHKPLDRQWLDRFADEVRPIGRACDLGCGPGQVAHYLRGRGLPVVGVDLSSEMVRVARGLNPEVDFVQGDMLALPFRDESLGGIASFYSIIHLPRPRVVDSLIEMRRVLRPGGRLLMAFHVGEQVIHLDELWGHPISIDFRFFRAEQIASELGLAGFRVVDAFERAPYPHAEYPSRRAYLFAEKPQV